MGEPTTPLADGAQGPEFGSSASVSMTMQIRLPIQKRFCHRFSECPIAEGKAPVKLPDNQIFLRPGEWI